MGIKVNFADIAVLPSGAYTVEVQSIEEKEAGENAKNPGAPYLTWTFVVMEPAAYVGRTVKNNTMLSGPGLFGLKNTLKALGYDDFDTEMDLEFTELIGKTLIVELEIKQYQGEDQNNIKKFLPV